MQAYETEDSERLVQVFAVENEDWQLTVRKFTSSLTWSELFETETIINSVSFDMCEDHADTFSTTDASEKNNFVRHEIFV